MKNLLLVCLILISCNHFVKAQSDTAVPLSKYNFYFDAGSLFFISAISLNVERKIFSSKSEKLNLYARAGLGYLYVLGWETVSIGATGGPVGLTMLLGKEGNHFEVFAGAFIGYFNYKEGSCFPSCDYEDRFNAFPLVEIGYRYQKPEGGFIFRAKAGTSGMGISLGHAF